MTTPRYIRTPDGKLVAVPTPITPPEEVEEVEEAEEEKDELSDVFEVTEEDVLGKDEDNIPQELTEEDEDDLFGVPEPDAVEEPPKPKKPKLRRTIKRFPPPPTTLGGMRT